MLKKNTYARLLVLEEEGWALEQFFEFLQFSRFFPFLTFFGCTVGVDSEVPICFLGYSNVYLCCMNAKNDNSYQHNYILEALHTALVNWFWRILTIFAIFAYLIARFWSKMGTSRQDESGPKFFPLFSGHHEQPRTRVPWWFSTGNIVWHPLTHAT